MSTAISDFMQKLRERLDALQPRERNIVLILVLVVVAFLWDLLCYSPLQNSVKNTQDELTARTDQIARLTQQINELTQTGDKNPVRQLQSRQQGLETAIQQLDVSIARLTGNLIPAKKMVQVLEDVLHRSSDLQLLAVTSLPVRRLIAEPKEKETGVAAANETGHLYLHAVELELRGSYFEALAYLQALEDLPWQVIWDQLEYRVDGYPQAEIRLRINTLSSSAGLLGV